jgi:CBS domain-containing protein
MSDFKVSNIMRTEVISVRKDTPIGDAIREMIVNNITGMPVIDEHMTLQGIISEKDLLKLLYDYENNLLNDKLLSGEDDAEAYNEKNELIETCSYLLKDVSKRELLDLLYECGTSSFVKDFMTEEVISLNVDDDLAKVCKCFMKHSFRRVPIISEGKLVGIISRKDILHHIYNCQSFFRDVSGRVPANF